MFANADCELRLWVDGKLVEFDRPTTYDDLNLKNEIPQSAASDPGDLAPVGIGSKGAAVEAAHLRVLRDIYYIADTTVEGEYRVDDYGRFGYVPSLSRRELARFWSSPELWRTPDGTSVFETREAEVFHLGPDQFFVLGDNSPASSDARLWPGQNYVDRELLVGKALFVYWPHPLRLFIPFTDASLSIIPNVPQMGFIR
jgi:signal peptidase I